MSKVHSMGYYFRLEYMIVHTTVFEAPVDEHWLAREIHQLAIDWTTHRTKSGYSTTELVPLPVGEGGGGCRVATGAI